MEPNHDQAHQMNSREFSSVGLNETSKIARTRESATIRRRLAKGIAGALVAIGLTGIIAGAGSSDVEKASIEQKMEQDRLQDIRSLSGDNPTITIPSNEVTK